MSINWTEAVKEYKEQYDDEDGIYEYVESLLPVYYGDIYQTYHDVIGTPLKTMIEPHHVGLEFWKIMAEHIFEAFLGRFYEAWNEAEEEE
jgi:hypothetical protein|tara:strand:- start:2063 stop:2332 length:270 start_codon:yes stop_codon:yes gene_type:complete